MICPNCKENITCVPDIGRHRPLGDGEIPGWVECWNCRATIVDSEVVGFTEYVSIDDFMTDTE